jgi:YVTN family beta-propeller protein
VNPVTNKIYVANSGSDNVTVIDGIDNSTTDVAVRDSPCALAINPMTNRIYVANSGSDNVTVIDGIDNSTTDVAVGDGPCALAINLVTNKIYVANSGSDSVTVIDGTSNCTINVAVGDGPCALAINLVTNRVYVAVESNNDVIIIDAVNEYETGVIVEIDTLPNHVTYDARPALTGKAVNRWQPNATAMLGVVDNWLAGQEEWVWATITSGLGTDSIHWQYSWNGDSLILGENFINVVSLESQAAITNNLGLGTPFAGNMLVYPIYRMYPLGVEEKTDRPGFRPYTLFDAYPNPSRDHVVFRYQLPKNSSSVRLDIYDITGRLVKRFNMGEQEPGYYELNWDGANVSGVYFYKLSSDDHQTTKKVVIID